jgi:hypothetical protein
MTALLVLVFLVLVGPLAVLYGADSRLPNDGWGAGPVGVSRRIVCAVRESAGKNDSIESSAT